MKNKTLLLVTSISLIVLSTIILLSPPFFSFSLGDQLIKELYSAEFYSNEGEDFLSYILSGMYYLMICLPVSVGSLIVNNITYREMKRSDESKTKKGLSCFMLILSIILLVIATFGWLL